MQLERGARPLRGGRGLQCLVYKASAEQLPTLNFCISLLTLWREGWGLSRGLSQALVYPFTAALTLTSKTLCHLALPILRGLFPTPISRLPVPATTDSLLSPNGP